MLLRFDAPEVSFGDAAGDVVSERRVRFGSQAEEIQWLRSMVREYRGVHAIVSRARDIVFRQRGCEPKDKLCQALAIASWVQDRITYVEEMPERFQTPTTTIAMGYGDCDDFTTLIASLLESIGIESELVGMQWSVPGEGKFYRHIFPRAVVTQGGRVYEIPLDATERQDIYELMNPVEVALALGRKDLRLYVA